MSVPSLDSLAQLWANAVWQWPHKTAAIWHGESYSYARLDDLIGRAAGALSERLSVAKGDRVAVVLPNCLEYLIIYWAMLRIGAVIAPVNTRLRAGELRFVLENLDPVVLCWHPETQQSVTEAMGGELPWQVIGLEGAAGTAFDALASHPHMVTEPASAVPDDLVQILHTSGTTGQPKGAMMTQETMLFNLRQAILAHSFRHDDIHLLAIPTFSPTACYSLLPSTAYLGGTLCIAPGPDIPELVKLIQRHRCTTFIGVPTLFHLFTSWPGLVEADLSSLRLIAYSGSPMPARTIKRLRELVPQAALHNFFGLTETISITHVLPSQYALERADSIGKLLPEVYAKVVSENGEELPRGEVGTLLIHRDNIIPGYWNQPGRLEEAIEGDWFNTGDLAYVDEQGFFYLQGREKDMIIVAGQNVYALEVERVILEHDGVQEVAVVGVPATGARAALGELVKAVVVPQPDVELGELDIKRHCSDRLPSYKVPQIVEFCAELSKNAAGKVLKGKLV